MAKKRKTQTVPEILPPAPATPQPITETIEKNYMPYVMSVIVSRAIPEIDGFKPAHRKLLYTMYKMGLMSGPRTKSANVVGATMKLNPHGDAAIYETMVRLTRDNEALLHPFVDSKGSFGKQYSSSTAYSAARYTEVRLDSFCHEIFRGIDKNAVEMVDNYDATMKEPVLLPTAFPNILVTPNMGIAVGMASNICSFNLSEICDGTIALLKNPKLSMDKLMDLIKAPDFPGGGYLIYDRDSLREVFETGSGSVKLRARYIYDKAEGCIEVLQIPYSTTIEQIMKKMTELVKEGKLKEVSDFRDETDINGFKLTIDIRRGTDPDKLMARLFKQTPLEDSFKCNFNVLIDSAPRQMGVREILEEWIRFRIGCVKRELTFELGKKKDKLHLLLGLGKILLDIDKAIRIVRETAKEEDVIPNLMAGFKIDEIQAEYIAEIKLRYLNREYILNRIKEIEDLQAEIAELEAIIGDELKLKAVIVKQLTEIKKKYSQPRKTQLIYADEVEELEEEDLIENYNVRLILTREGYFKKITFASLRGNDEQKLKDGDEVAFSIDTDNRAELLFLTDRAQLYRARVSDFDPVKASAMGDFLASKLGMEEGERPIFMRLDTEVQEDEHFIFIFANGKGVRVPLTAYQTKSTRRKQSGIFSTASPIVAAFCTKDPLELLLVSSAERAIQIKSALIPMKTTRTAAGVQLINLKAGQTVIEALDNFAEKFDTQGCRKLKIPAAGSPVIRKNAPGEQLKLDE
ncbi:MAG: topoisomerase IV [Ruminococcaceae bacterium]|nr:topoisomerase IV [Oscillospiraceae bacterium]